MLPNQNFHTLKPVGQYLCWMTTRRNRHVEGTVPVLSALESIFLLVAQTETADAAGTKTSPTATASQAASLPEGRSLGQGPCARGCRRAGVGHLRFGPLYAGAREVIDHRAALTGGVEFFMESAGIGNWRSVDHTTCTMSRIVPSYTIVDERILPGS